MEFSYPHSDSYQRPSYELALLGEPTAAQVDDIQGRISAAVSSCGLSIGSDVALYIRPNEFAPRPRVSAAALFFGGKDLRVPLANLLSRRIPIIPVVSTLSEVTENLPLELRSFNALSYNDAGPDRVAAALLECAGLLRRQRRVFLSYRREEARRVALQLFDSLSERQFDVFLDTHGVAPGDDFQSVIWHRLCDSDVLVMIDTPTYFASRWTSAEFGRALAKNIPVLRIGWPGCDSSPRTATASHIDLDALDIEEAGVITEPVVMKICHQLEVVRSGGIAVRRVNLVGGLAHSVQMIGGSVEGVGPANGVHLRLPDGCALVVYPAVGVPTSLSLHEAVEHAPNKPVAVIYDHVGLNSKWLQHLDWLGGYISGPRWIKASEAAWQLADWRRE